MTITEAVSTPGEEVGWEAASQQAVFTLVCNDFDSDDGTTTYFLLDPSGNCIGEHAWPMPLIDLAHEFGGTVERRSNLGDTPGQWFAPECYVREYEVPDRENEALDWLEKELAEGPLPVRFVERRAREAGVTPQRLREASLQLGVEKRRVWRRGFAVGTNRNKGSFGTWSLPGQFDREEAIARAEAVGVTLTPAVNGYEVSYLEPETMAPEDVLPGEEADDVLTASQRREILEAIDLDARTHVRARRELEKDIEHRVNGNGNGNGRSPVMDQRLKGLIEDIAGEPVDVEPPELVDQAADDAMEAAERSAVKMTVTKTGVTKMCKIDGCPNVATGKASFSGLCDLHKSEEASRRNRKGHKNRKAEKPEEHPVKKLRNAVEKREKGKTVPPSERIVVDDATRELLDPTAVPTLADVAKEIEDLRSQRDEIDRLITERVDSLVELARSY